jgi:hypothetical protein
MKVKYLGHGGCLSADLKGSFLKVGLFAGFPLN